MAYTLDSTGVRFSVLADYSRRPLQSIQRSRESDDPEVPVFRERNLESLRFA